MLQDCSLLMSVGDLGPFETPKQLRFTCTTGIFGTSAMGSSYVELCGSKVAAKVHLSMQFGNRVFREVDQFGCGTLLCDVSFANYLTVQNSTSASSLIMEAVAPAILLDQYPKQVVSLSIMVLQSSIYDVSAMIDAAALALADAKIEMTDLCCSFCALSKNPESHDINASVTVVTMPRLGRVSNVIVEGRIPPSELSMKVNEAVVACKEMRSIMVKELCRGEIQ